MGCSLKRTPSSGSDSQLNNPEQAAEFFFFIEVVHKAG
jgi:hypothetical protein